MKPEIFDGGGSFEHLYWTGQDSAREAPNTAMDNRMEITVTVDEKKKDEKKEKEKKVSQTAPDNRVEITVTIDEKKKDKKEEKGKKEVIQSDFHLEEVKHERGPVL